MATLSVILIAPPGFWRKSLHVLLHAAPAVGAIHLCDDTERALCSATDVAPSLIIVDAAEGIQATQIAELRLRWPAACLLALAEEEQKMEMAARVGFHAALTKGVLATRLSAAIDALIEKRCKLGTMASLLATGPLVAISHRNS